MKENGFAPLIIILVIAILGVVGYFAYKNYFAKSQVLVVSSPSPSTATGPTADWKTYVNKTRSYSVKYPNGWFVSEGPDQTTMANFPTGQPPSSNKYVMYIGTYKETIGSSDNLTNWLKQNGHYTSDTYGNPASAEKTTVAGNQAVILNYSGESGFYVFSAGPHVFWAYSSPESSEFSETFRSILSTFISTL